MYCPSSPHQTHCYCQRMDGGNISDPYYSVIPPALKCCWCGASNMAEHGPYRGGPKPWWPYQSPGYTAPSTGTPFSQPNWSTCNLTRTHK